MNTNSSLRDKIVHGDLRKAVLSLAVPMAVGNIAHNIFGLTDMYFVGKLGSIAVAAVGMAGVVNMATITLLVGIATATRAMVSRYIGAGDFQAAHRAAVGSIVFGIIVSGGLALFGTLFARIILGLMGAEGELLDAATSYLLIMMWGSFSMVMVFISNSIFQGAGDARTPMIITVFAVAMNIVLDPMFIFGIGPFPKWGIEGAAFATVLSRFLGASIGLILLTRGVNAFKLHLSNFRTTKATMTRFLKIGIPGGGQTFLANIMGFIMMRLATGFGVAATAAYTIGIRLNMMALLPGFALGNAVATIVGQNLGAGNVQRAKQSTWMTTKYYECLVIPIALIYYFLAPDIIGLFSAKPDVILYGVKYLRIVTLSYPIFAVGSIILRAVNGAGHTMASFWARFAGLYFIQLPLAFILTGYIGSDGIWWSISAGMAVQSVILLPYFISMRWATKGKWND